MKKTSDGIVTDEVTIRLAPQAFKAALYLVTMVLLTKTSYSDPVQTPELDPNEGFGREAALARSLASRDTLRFQADFSSNTSLAYGINGEVGENLGTGGKLSFELNQRLNEENPNTGTVPVRRDFRTTDGDFGAIPLARGNNGYARMLFRFAPWVTGAFGMGLNGNSRDFNVDEVSLSMKPEIVPGLEVKLGQISDGTVYSPILNLSPFDAMGFRGMSVGYELSLPGQGSGYEMILEESERKLRFDIAYGNQLIGNTIQRDFFGQPGWANPGYVRSTIHRRMSAAKVTYKQNLFTGKALLGYQSLPKDSIIFSGVNTQLWNERQGWYTAILGELRKSNFGQSAMVGYASGEVETPFGKPLPSLQEYPGTSDQERFERKGSSLLALVTWGAWQGERYSLEYGFMAQSFTPNPAKRTQEDRSKEGDPPILDANGIPAPPPNITLEATPLKQIKLALAPSLALRQGFRLALRTDIIRYLTPDAHLNTQEVLSGPDQQPIIKRAEAGSAPVYFNGYSKWERESVNATVFSPMLVYRYKDIGQIQIMYSQGFYGSEVLKHGSLSKTHGTLSLNASARFHLTTGNMDK